ncbi:hypothetical protein LINPERHAP1_LOCUS14728 [Linum perenne]
MPAPPGNCDDARIWNHSKDGCYSVSSAYHLATDSIRSNHHVRIAGDWHKIWNLEVPPKVKNLIWRTASHVLPTKEALTTKGVGVPSTYGLCAAFDETAWHLFVECSTAKKCWELAGLLTKTEEARNRGGSIKNWILDVLSNTPPAVQNRFGGILWSLWKERNERVWNGKSRPEELILRLGDESVAEWQQLRRRNQPTRGTQVCPKWHPPARDQQFKINVDAAVFPDRLCHSAGAVIRNSDGGFIGLKQELFPGIIPARECEAKALLMAIDWMNELHLHSAILETDCQELERAFHKHTSGSSDDLPDLNLKSSH